MFVARFAGFVLSCALWLMSGTALGQDALGAKAMFDHAMKAKKSGNWEEACRAFGESQRLYPQPGTLFELASCEEHIGKFASASLHYHQFALDARGFSGEKRVNFQDRIAKADAAKMALEGKISTLTLVLPAATPAGTIVTRDGTTLTEVTLGVPIPVDAGEHVITTQVPNGRVHQQRITVVQQENKRIELEIESGSERQEAARLPGLTIEKKPSKPESRATKSESSTHLRTVGFVGLGLGVAGLALSGITGGIAMSKVKFVRETCPEYVCPSLEVQTAAKSTWNDARTMANLSTAGLVLGAVGIISGTVMLGINGARGENDSPKSNARARVIGGPSGAFLVVDGAF